MINNNELINEIKSYNKFLNPNSLNKAFKFAIDAHKNQKRDEGVPYIIHPVAVADLLQEIGASSSVIAAGLLHDVVEDTGIELSTIETNFGPPLPPSIALLNFSHWIAPISNP